MKGVLLKIFSAALIFAMVFSLCACSGGGVYHNDDNKKSYDRKYTPTTKNPLALTEDQEEEIKTAAIKIHNAAATEEYEAKLEQYNSDVEAEASKVEAMSKAAESDAKVAASIAKEESRNASRSSSRDNESRTSTVYEMSSNATASVYTSPDFVRPSEPDLKDNSDVSIYNYGGTYNGYIAIRYKIKGKAQVAAHQSENLTEDIIGSYNFSHYPDSPTMSMYKDGEFFTIREIFESGGISEQDLKDIWYYFYVED